MLPAFFKTPEVGYAGGITSGVTFKTTNVRDTITRSSFIQVLGFFTTRNVNAQSIHSNLFFNKNKHIILFNLAHQYFPDKFWGIGPNTKSDAFCNYTYESLTANLHLKTRLFNNFYFGKIFDYQNVFKINYHSNTSFDTSVFIGKKPYQSLGFGLSFSYDSRDNIFWPMRGMFAALQTNHYNKKIISNFSYTKWIFDFRFFQKIFKNQIFAFQIYSVQNFKNAPIRDLAAIGGANNLRGFYYGRFRDQKLITLIAEYRFKIYKQISGVVFGGTGNIFHNYTLFNINTSKQSAGLGLRYCMLKKDRLNLRLDYGYSDNKNQALYITIGESF